MISLKEYKHFLVTDPKEMEICTLPEKELKIIVLKNLTSYKITQIDNSTKSGK